MREPTQDELDATEVTPEDEREFKRTRAQIRLALYSANIPSNLEWALIMVDAATQVLVIQGMTRNFYLQLTDSQFAFSLSRLTRPPAVPNLQSLRKMQSTRVQDVQQLFDALRARKIDLGGNSDVAPHLLGLAGDVLAENAIPRPMFHELCCTAYELAEKRVTAMGKKHQA